jgi:hypothetical protein
VIHMEFLLSYGNAGDFARFRSDQPLACRRGDRLVVRSHRGQEIGTVMRPATAGHTEFLEDHFVGQILRVATPTDLDFADRMRTRSSRVFDDSRRLTGELALPLEILDAEVLLDGRQAILHHLRWADCDTRPLMDAISERYHLLVSLHDLALPKLPAEAEPAGCGEPNCGGGNCGSCSTGGCGICSSHSEAAKVAIVTSPHQISTAALIPGKVPLL